MAKIIRNTLLQCGLLRTWHAAAKAKHAGIELTRARPLVIGATIVAVICVNSISNVHIDTALQYGPFFLAPLFFALIMSISTEKQKALPTKYSELVPDLSFRSIFEKIGAMSYSIYLLHKFVGYNMMYYTSIGDYTENGIAFWCIFSLIFALIFLVSAVFYIEIENRFRIRSRKKAASLPVMKA